MEISGANVKVTLDNFFEAGSVLCVASYSGGALVGITSEIVKEGVSEYTFPLPGGADMVKAMLILDFDSLRPLCRCKSIEIIGE